MTVPVRVEIDVADTTEAEAWRDAARSAGFVCTAEAPDVIVADLHLAVARRWLAPGRPVAWPAPGLVVASEFGEFVGAADPRVATLRKPASAGALTDAIRRVYRPVGPGAAPPDPSAEAARLHGVTELRDGVLADPDPELELLVATIARELGVGTALLTLVEADRQTFAAATSEAADLARGRATPASWSVCRFVVAAEQSLRIADMRAAPALAGSPLVAAGVVGAYAGAPVRVDGVGTVGAICVLSREPRQFTDADVARLEFAARLAGACLSRRRSLPPAPPATPSPLPDSALFDGKYLLTATLGHGNYTQVWLGREARTGQVVVIKQVAAASFDGEVQPLASLRHPNLVRLSGWGTAPDGRDYIVLEHIEGESLADVLASARARRRALSDDEVLSILDDVAGVLATLLGAGVVHGDIKPANIIFDHRYGRAVVIDLGLGQRVGRRSRGGTPGYSAPEQFGADPIDGRADVYALAALAWALIAGNGPFSAVPPAERAAAQRRGELPSLTSLRPGLSPEVEVLLTAALSPVPTARPSSAVGFVGALRRAMRERRAPERLASRAPCTRGLLFRRSREEAAALLGVSIEAHAFSALDRDARAVFEQASDDLYHPSAAFAAYLRLVRDGVDLAVLARRAVGDRLRDQLLRMRLPRDLAAVEHGVAALLERDHDGLVVRTRRRADGALDVALAGEHLDVLGPWTSGTLRLLASLCGRPSRIEVASVAAGVVVTIVPT